MKVENKKMHRMDAMPLARNVVMPSNVPYPLGAVSIRFDGLTIENGLKAAEKTEQMEDGRRVLSFTFRPCALSCECIVETKPDPVQEIDTGGNLMPLRAQKRQISEEKEQWLEQARTERTRLAQTPNGQKLLIEYGRHNEVFDEVFKSRSFQRTWKADGLTEQLSRDTYQALQDNSTINDKIYHTPDGREVSYNAHAFYEQTALSMATLLADPDYDPHKPPTPSKYTEASEAALQFGAAVETTGNKADATAPLRPEEVYGYVNAEQRPMLMRRSMPDVDAPLRFYAAQAKAEKNPAKARMLAAGQPEDPYRLRELYDSMLAERAADTQIKGSALYRTACSGEIPADGFGARVCVQYENGKASHIAAVQFSLPDFPLSIDDAGWSPEILRAVEESLREADFLKSYLHRAISETLSEMLREAVARDENCDLR